MPVLILFFLALACNNQPKQSDNLQLAQPDEPAPIEREPTSGTGETPPFSHDYLTGKFEPSLHPDFIKIDAQYSDGSEMWLRKDTYSAFIKMYEAALKDGIRLKIISATRTFSRQKQIWEAKWNGTRLVEGRNLSTTIPDPMTRALKILEYSSMPGSSRHHWGTDIDLNNLEPSWFSHGEGAAIYTWLSRNAHQFGFCQPYSKKGPDRPSGYNEEHWHWSYMPVASQLTRLAQATLTDNQFSGFEGCETATGVQIVKKYMLGINPDCMP